MALALETQFLDWRNAFWRKKTLHIYIYICVCIYQHIYICESIKVISIIYITFVDSAEVISDITN